ncbi:GNAT family N-acetyltransferase [Flaviaesturariibacter amylovorans]|uniref:GNAT family N-acetyltransferase n=1 Tax=Flaviaesturariibacter amylovorans TaxID=1084520 RepID=A0ABP8G8W1_9BACT
MQPGIILQTDRLRLRRFTTGDAAFIVALLNSPGWLRFIGDRGVHNEADALRYLGNGPFKSYAERGFGLSLVETKEGTAAGMCGILVRDTMDYPDIGFAFLPEHAGKGYGYEIASTTLRHARSAWGLTTIDAITLPDNTASIRLLERLRMHRIGTSTSPAGEELLLYRSSHTIES